MRLVEEGCTITGTWFQGHLQGDAVYHYPDGSHIKGLWDLAGDLSEGLWYDRHGQPDPLRRQFCFVGQADVIEEVVEPKGEDMNDGVAASKVSLVVVRHLVPCLLHNYHRRWDQRTSSYSVHHTAL